MTSGPVKVVAIYMAIGLLAALPGCGGQASPDNVDRRAVERWNYLIEHKAERAWDYLTPGARSIQSREDYAATMNNRPIQWKAVKFVSKDCEADRCKVKLEVSYSLPMPAMRAGGLSSMRTQSETWLLLDGAWYFLPK